MPLDALVDHASRLVSTRRGQPAIEAMPGLHLVQEHSTSSSEPMLYEPVLCLILHGRKQISIGDRTLSFGRGECLLVTHDLPVHSSITKAPYLALIFELDIAAIRKLYDDVAESTLDTPHVRAVESHRASPGLLDALRRYLALAESPADAKVLGPLISKEIHYRLLMAPFGGMLRQLIRHDTSASAIARAIAHIRAHIRAPITVPDLARRVGMSASSFHQHFKQTTSTTPLQYQKELRLLEARRLLGMGGASVTSVAFEVGYESASQFSREYARTFGVPPSQDLERRGTDHTPPARGSRPSRRGSSSRS
jgi:AraC-like DNA-binding protein